MNRFYLIVCPPIWIKTPPLGVEFLKQFLRNKKIEAHIIDLNAILYKILKIEKSKWLTLNKDFEENLFSLIKEKYPHIIENIINKLKNAYGVGFSLFFRNRNFTFNLAKKIKEAYPAKKIIIGGPEVLFMKLRKETFCKDFFWIVGEGEKSLYKVLTENLIDNLIESEEIIDLDQLPFLDFSQFNLNLYSPILPLFSSRGCIRRCKFCTERLLFKKFRQHSPEYMIEQISFLKEKLKIDTFSFQDSLINANLEWLERFSLSLIKRNLQIKWEAQMIVRKDMKDDLVKLIKKSGCFNIFIGLESASDKILQKMNKGFTYNDAICFFEILKKAGIHFEISLIVGYDGETESDFQKTCDFLVKNKKLIPKIAQVNPYIDYYHYPSYPSKESIERVKYIVEILKREKIPFTKSFINNLFYQ